MKLSTSDKVKNEWIYTSTLTSDFMTCKRITLALLYLLLVTCSLIGL